MPLTSEQLESRRQYRVTDAYRERAKRYRASDRAKAVRREYDKKYRASDIGKQKIKELTEKYRLSEEYVKSRNAYRRNKYSVESRGEHVIARALLLSAKRRAKLKGFDYGLTIDDIQIPECCPLLGIKLFRGSGKVAPHSPTLDRINNDFGYVPGNVWVISHRANCSKSDLTVNELLYLANRLKERLEGVAA